MHRKIIVATLAFFSGVMGFSREPLRLTLAETEQAVAWAMPNDRELRVVLKNGVIRDYSVPELALLRTTQLQGGREPLNGFPFAVLSADGRLLFESGMTSLNASVTWEISTNQRTLQLTRLAGIPRVIDHVKTSAAISPTKNYIVISTIDTGEHQTSLWNPRTGRFIANLPGSAGIGSSSPFLQFNETGSRLLRSIHSAEPHSHEWDLRNGTNATLEMDSTEWKNPVSYFPLQSTLATISDKIRFYHQRRPSQLTLAGEYEVVCDSYYPVYFSHEGNLGFCRVNTQLMAWDTQTGRHLANLEGEVPWPFSPVFSPSSHWLALAQNPRVNSYHFQPRTLLLHEVGRINEMELHETLAQSLERLQRTTEADLRRQVFERLIRSPETVALIAAQLSPEREINQEERNRLLNHLRHLEHEDFGVRTRATDSLDALYRAFNTPTERRTFALLLTRLAYHATLSVEGWGRLRTINEEIPIHPTFPITQNDTDFQRFQNFQILSHLRTAESRALLERLRDQSVEGSSTKLLAIWALNLQRP